MDQCEWRPEDKATILSQAVLSDSMVNTVVMLATTFAHKHFAANAIHSLEQQSVFNHIIVTPDSSMLTECSKNNWQCVLGPPEPSPLSEGSSSSTSTGTFATQEDLQQHSQGYNR
jgi:hypothetical protein